ncbi:transglycosylase SLT domain-containing protein [Asticcacaulis sp. 201]|uniref:lytic transglycosylase domain-containing protein n=1 Tax=Asticcacaulis sp. 201 TaxID=3028787 RepID=UPI0029160AD7|nr:transglycosylase SLT domain-containing protein [Asticcacaulis sp. 201]MDV6329587.1 transglycosylase SLT domain-containing protein [Asticcacaulis sp. 201]
MTPTRTLLSLTALAFALMANTPANATMEPASAHTSTKKASTKKASTKTAAAKTAAETHAGKKSTKTTDTDDDVKSAKSKKSEAADSKSSKASKSAKSKETAKADDSDDAPVAKKSKAKETAEAGSSKKSKKTDTADAASPHKGNKSDSEDAPVKTGKKTELAEAKSSKAKKKTSDEDTEAAPTKRGKKTELAEVRSSKAKKKTSDGDDETAPTKKGKKTELADNVSSEKKSRGKTSQRSTEKPVTKVSTAKVVPSVPVSKVAVLAASASFASSTTSVSTPDAQPVMNAAPLPYHLVAGQGTPVAPTPLNTILAANDAQIYQAAFTLIDQGDYAGADAQLATVTDRSLMGYAQYHKLFSRGYNSTYEELMAWLAAYGDHPQAMKVWNLAKRKKPEGAPDPAFPRLAGAPAALGTGIPLASLTTFSSSSPIDSRDDLTPEEDSLTPKSARSAYNNGQLDQAVKLGRKIGDHWVAGLASWRLKHYDDALAEFKFVSSDPSANAWTQSSGAYWAARCAQKLGRTDDAQTFLQLAASFPFTFYGLLAEQRLGVTPAVRLAQKGLPPTFSRDQRSALTASLTSDFAWTNGNVRAQRLNALVQVGRTEDAKDELQAAIQSSASGAERDQWLAFGTRTHVPYTQLKPTDRLFDVTLYPLPDISPRGGFVIDKALIFAIARKESKFNAEAHSYAGAYGLMQLMPATAALIEGDNSFNSKPKQLLKPAVNLHVGQNYIMRLQGSSIISGDLLRTIAAYNAGARPVKDAVDSLGNEADSLLVMESIPVAQTRQYVEEVVANYWIYRQIMGKDSKTLALAANDARIVDLTADSPAPASEVALADK